MKWTNYQSECPSMTTKGKHSLCKVMQQPTCQNAVPRLCKPCPDNNTPAAQQFFVLLLQISHLLLQPFLPCQLLLQCLLPLCFLLLLLGCSRPDLTTGRAGHFTAGAAGRAGPALQLQQLLLQSKLGVLGLCLHGPCSIRALSMCCQLNDAYDLAVWLLN